MGFIPHVDHPKIIIEIHYCMHVDTLISCWSCLRTVNNFTKLMHEGMPNNSVIWEKPHLSWGSFSDLCSCIKCHVIMSVHCIWCILVIYCVPPLLLCFSRSRSWSATKVLRHISTTFAATRQDIFPLLCAYLLTYVFPQIFLHIILHSIPKYFGQNRVSYQLHKYLIPLHVSIPNIHRIVWWPE